MKSPREVILSHHTPATAKLDAIRAAAVAELTPAAPTTRPSIPLVLKLWRELIWPCRRTWASLALAWIALATLNASQQNAGAPRIAAGNAAETRLAYHEQKQLLNELLGTTPPSSPAAAIVPRKPEARPRSQARTAAAA